MREKTGTRQNKRIGITGEVGSGKTTAAKYLEEEYGAKLFLTDEIAKDLMKPGLPCYEKILEKFGPQGKKEDKTLDREYLAQKIFQDATLREWMNQCVHPAVTKELKKQIEETELLTPKRMIVIESALLFQVHYEKFCDEVMVMVLSSRERRKRLMESRGYSRERIQKMEESQSKIPIPREDNIFFLENDGNPEELKRKILAHFK